MPLHAVRSRRPPMPAHENESAVRPNVRWRIFALLISFSLIAYVQQKSVTIAAARMVPDPPVVLGTRTGGGLDQLGGRARGALDCLSHRGFRLAAGHRVVELPRAPRARHLDLVRAQYTCGAP